MKIGYNTYYKYTDGGFRVSKTVNGVTTQFVLDDSGNILKQTIGSTTMLFLYDDNGGRVGLQYNGANYLYVYNAQGDVTAIVDSNHNVVVSYTYDEWGAKVSVTGSMAGTLGVQNPFRYRGYCYDEETGWYYLQSRYYDPVTGRFLNTDGQINSTILGANLFAYCENNPVMRADSNGQFWHIVGGAVIGGLIGGISSIVGQAISGNGINWAEVGVSAASGALTGAITAACPGMGALATGLIHGAVGAGTYAATELVNGRTPTLGGTLAAGITSGVLAGVTKAISNKIGKPNIPKNTGTPFKGVGSSQVGVDPNTLTLDPNFTPHPGKYASALARIKSGGMYGAVEVTRNGLVINGQHRTLIGRMLGLAVDVTIR